MSSTAAAPGRLDRSVDPKRDHVLGPDTAPITLVEYGSYACPHCRAANDRITEVRTELGERVRYVFRQRPLTGSDLARRAAELVEQIEDPDRFWDAHVELMTRSETLTEEDLVAVAQEFGLADRGPEAADAAVERARARVLEDEASARASGVSFTPTFFISGRRYDGPWDESSFEDAMLGSLGHRVRAAALEFASWAPSTGVLLAIATVAAILITNGPVGESFAAFWETRLGLAFGGREFAMSLLHWINDAVLTVFFLVVGLEIKREFTVGSLASRRSAALPIAAALGGMLAPTLLYLLVIPEGPWRSGWGVPMATDTAFAVALIAMMGVRAPVELRIFLTAAAIVDDIGAITVVAVFYSGEVNLWWLWGAAGVTLLLAVLNRASVYQASWYLLAGVLLWICVYQSGLHATLAGVLLAAFIPTRQPPNYRTLALQAEAILSAEAKHEGEQYRLGPSEQALRALDDIHDRLESPADRMLRTVAPRSSFLVLPIFALANAGVVIEPGVFEGHGPLLAALMAGLVIGKPLGFVGASWLAIRAGLASKPQAYSWRQLLGAGALAGIGFTMSLFIAGQSFPDAKDFAAAKIAVFLASLISAAIGVWVLWSAKSPQVAEGEASEDGAVSASPAPSA
jgi:NhaA family Na+:H+ antiporter